MASLLPELARGGADARRRFAAGTDRGAGRIAERLSMPPEEDRLRVLSAYNLIFGAVVLARALPSNLGSALRCDVAGSFKAMPLGVGEAGAASIDEEQS